MGAYASQRAISPSGEIRAHFLGERWHFLFDDVGERKGKNRRDIVWCHIDHMTDFPGTEDDVVEVLSGLVQNRCE